MLAQGLAFPLLLVAVEAVRFAVVPAPPVLGPEIEFAAPYLAAAAAHPWTPGSIAAAAPLLLPVGVAAAVLGVVLGGLFARIGSDRAEPVEVPARPAPGVARA